MNKNIILVIIAILFIKNTSFSFETAADYAILMNEKGDVLFEKQSEVKMAPSSMSKMMTAYTAFDFLKKNLVKENDLITISEKSWKTEGSRMFVQIGTKVPLIELLKGLIIQSGNDAAVAIAEGISGSEEEFASQMNKLAKEINLTNSNFVNATGLPNSDHYTSAKDLAIIALRTIKDFPEYYKLYGETEYSYNSISQANRNGLLHKNIGCDGLKTGHTADAGYGLCASAYKNNRRLISVVNGLKSDKERLIESEKLLAYGFTNFREIKVNNNEKIGRIKILYGNVDFIDINPQEDLNFTIEAALVDKVKIVAKIKKEIKAPVKIGDEIGMLILQGPNINREIILKSTVQVDKCGFLQRIFTNLKGVFGLV